MTAEKRLGQESGNRKAGKQKVARAKPLQIGGRFVVLDTVASTCGTTHTVWLSRRPVVLFGIFVNLGICSIRVTISGRGRPVTRMIPSRGGLQAAQIIVHPAATKVTIECLSNFPGDCRVVYLLVF